jgi:hypothetical protein
MIRDQKRWRKLYGKTIINVGKGELNFTPLIKEKMQAKYVI